MAIRKFRAGQSSYSADTYVGTHGTIFYNEDTGELRLSDGITPGGIAIPITLATTSIAGSLRPGSGFTIGSNGLLSLNAGPMFELDENQVFQLKPGTVDVIGGIRPGPGVIINSEGQLLIDTAGLDFSFGDFYAFTNLGPSDGACLSSVTENQDINIVSNGTGMINIIGEFNIHQTNETLEDALTSEPILSVTATGKIRVLAPNTGGLNGAVEIIGNNTGSQISPNQTGVVVHITGNQDMVARNYIDGVNNYSLLVGRRYNGTPLSPTNVKNNEIFFRIAGQASTDGEFQTFGPCQIDWIATEDQGPTNQGGEIRIRATPNGVSSQSGIVQVAAFNGTTGVTAIKFNGPLTGNVISTNTGSTVLNTSGSTAIFTGNVTGTASTLKGSVISSNTNNTVLDTSSTIALFTGNVNGKLIHTTRDAGTIAAGGTLTIDFSTDDIVKCVWGDGLVLSYQNYTAGRIVRVLATKAAGTGTDSISLDGVTANQVSSGATSISSSADVTTYIELICTNSTLASLFIKL